MQINFLFDIKFSQNLWTPIFTSYMSGWMSHSPKLIRGKALIFCKPVSTINIKLRIFHFLLFPTILCKPLPFMVIFPTPFNFQSLDELHKVLYLQNTGFFCIWRHLDWYEFNYTPCHHLQYRLNSTYSSWFYVNS